MLVDTVSMSYASSNLDILRSTAVLLVLLEHLSTLLGYEQNQVLNAWGIQTIGQFGVLMFFIHTSLVLMFSLQRLEADGHGSLLRRFYVRRAFRIYPLSLVAILLTLALRIPPFLEAHYPRPSVQTIVANVFLVQNITGSDSMIAPLWSLPYEVQSYLALPLLYMLASRLRSYWEASCLCIAGLVLLTLEGLFARAAGYHAILVYAPWFCMGAAAYSVSLFIKPTIGSKWFVICLMLLVASPFLAHRLVSPGQSFWIILAAGIFFALSLSRFLNVTTPILVRPSHFIARYSYSIYLAHVPILWFVFRKMAGQPQWLKSVILVFLMVSVPLALYHLIEEPLIRRGASISRALARPTEVAVRT